jgi:DNA-binding NtrC family response regulator
MLLRAAVSVREGTLYRRLSRILRERSAWVEPVDIARLEPTVAVHAYDLVFTGPETPPGLIASLLRAARDDDDAPAVVRLYAASDPEVQASLLGEGLAASIWTGLEDEPLARAVDTVVERRRAEIDLAQGRKAEGPRLRDFRSFSSNLRRLRATVQKVARTDSTALVLGETGVGKEWLARAIHQESPRRDGPFVPVNCGAFTEALLESELFGHERGAFTGAERTRRGHFELAHGGTLFLDEIGEMPKSLQTRLLRVLEDRTVQRVGSETSVKVDVRIVAATHRDLGEEVRAGRFRADLYYRLRVVQLDIPPLRERREDIPSLARFHVQAAAKRMGVAPMDITEEAMAALSRYDWPGNVRELANVVERAVILSRGEPIGIEELPEELRGRAPSARPADAAPPTRDLDPLGLHEACALPWKEARQLLLDRVEREYFLRLLSATSGRVGEAAKRAGLSERGLFDKLRRHRISKDSFRGRADPRGSMTSGRGASEVILPEP